MSELAIILSENACAVDANVTSRKRALERASELVATSVAEATTQDLYDALLARERLGSTALGDGVAIPHCRAACGGIRAAFLKLDTPVDFDAPDAIPVDLIFVLVVPENETEAHLEVLAKLAGLFGSDANRQRLREATTGSELREQLTELENGAAR